MPIFDVLHVTKDGKTYDIINKRNAVAILPIVVSKNGNIQGFHLIKQFRVAIARKIIEVPAGTMEDEEHPIDCALRELTEETGIVANKDRMNYFGTITPSPGYTNELIHLYTYRVLVEDYRNRRERTGDDRDIIEEMYVERKMLNEIMIDIVDAKTLILLNYAKELIAENKKKERNKEWKE